MKISIPILLLAGFLFTLNACTDPPPPSLNAKDRELIDSLFRLEIKVLKPELDSLCDATFDQRVQVAVDSMLIVRRAEIERQLQRIRQQ